MKVAVFNPDAKMAADYRHLLEADYPELDVHATADEDELKHIMEDAEIFLGFRPPVDVFAGAKSLRWLHHTSAGMDVIVPAKDYLKDVLVTNSSGIHSLIADYCMCVMLMLHWDFRRLLEDQKVKNWRMFRTVPMDEFTVGIVGLGSIGKEIVRRAEGLSMNIVGLRRSGAAVDGVSAVYTPDQLNEMLPKCDFVILAAPGTAETKKMISTKELASMKETAFLINIGRGDVIDEAALVDALQNDQIAGAALDVFETEPLPHDSPLWDMENVIVTPHVSGTTSRYVERVVAKFGENLEMYKAGKPLPNTVDLDLGY